MVHQHCHYETQCGMLQQCIENVCTHDVVFPLSWYTSFIYFITPIVLGIGMLGGLGGGVLKGPILEMTLNYSQADATIISYALMFGGCIVNGIQLIFQKHPQFPQRPIIDYQVAMIQNCALSMGSVIGSTLNVFLPQFYVAMFQEFLLIPIIIYLWRKGMNELKKRREAVKVEEKLEDTMDSDLHSFVEEVEIAESSKMPVIPICVILGFFSLTQIMTTLLPKVLPTPAALSGCFTLNYLMLFLLIAINPSLTYIVYIYMRREQTRIVKPFLNTTKFSRGIFLRMYFAGFLAGFVSGFIGLGAGLVMVPAMLHIGLHPRAASSTSAFNYLFISVTNLITMITKKLLPIEIALWFAGLAFIGGSLVTKAGYVIIEKYKISYVVVFIVVALAFANVIAAVWYISMESSRFGFSTLIKLDLHC